MAVTHRENKLLVHSNGNLASSCEVIAYPVGAVVVSAASSTYTVAAGHSFRAGDKVLRNPGSDDEFSGTDTVQSATATTVVMGTSVTGSAGDILVNLGPDTGTSSPDFDASPLEIYSDAGGTTAIANSSVVASAKGIYTYFHKGDGRLWELVLDATGTIVDLIAGFGGVANRHNTADYGCTINGSTDDAARLQAAIVAAEHLNEVIYLPAGTCLVNSEIALSGDAITMQGDGMILSIVAAGGSFPASSSVLNFDDADSSNRCTFRDFQVNGGSLADYGILGGESTYGPSHGLYERIRIVGTKIAAFSLGNCNSTRFSSCEASANDGDGFYLNEGGNNNAIVFDACKSFGNGEVGIRVSKAKGVQISGCVIEANQECGILIHSSTSVNLSDNYFERNCADGITFTTPSTTIKADVVLNGSSTPLTTMASTYPCYGINARGNYHSVGETGYAETAYYIISGEGVTLDGNTVQSSSGDATLLGFRNDNACVITDLAARNNVVGASTLAQETIVNVDNITADFMRATTMSWSFSNNKRSNRANQFYDSTNDSPVFDNPRPVNWFSDRVERWSLQFADDESTSVTQDGEEFNGHPALYVDGNDIYGISIDLSDFPELQGQYVWVGGWIKTDESSAVIRYYVHDGSSFETHTQSTTTNSGWYREGRLAKFPTSGTVKVGVRGDTQGSERGWICMPTLAVLGASWEEIWDRSTAHDHGQFQDLTFHGGLIAETVATLANDATPSVALGNLFKTGGTTTITDLDDGVVGQTVTILAAHSVTMTHNASIIKLSGGSNFSMTTGDTLTLAMIDDQVWSEVSRMDIA